jgi:transposase
VERPERQRPSSRRNLQKSDPSDAEGAARAVLAGETSGVSKSGDGTVEMIRALRGARRSAIKARTQAANQLQALRVTAPEQLRHRLRGLSTKELVSVAARFRLADGPSSDGPAATKFALRSVARRPPLLRGPLEGDLRARGAPRSAGGARSRPGVDLLAWHRHRRCRDAVDRGRGHPERLRSEASFATLCGVAPIEASSGKVVRHSLNRGGNREANRALYMICLARMRRDPRAQGAQEYVARRTTEGKSKPEIIRCLKRYLAREAYRVLITYGARSSPTGP